MREYRFLIDNDSQAASAHFPEKCVVMLAQAKLARAAPDTAVVARAREMGCIIVTANGPDFEKEIKHFLQKSQRKDCFDLYGLVVIPNAATIQARVLPGLGDKLRMNGKRISWEDVWQENYLVGSIRTARLRCENQAGASTARNSRTGRSATALLGR
jgi:hypothetical protein